MKFLIWPFLFLLFSCTSTDTNQKAITPKGPSLRLSKDYGNIKSLANAVCSGVLDSCINNNMLAFEEMIKITPKMHQMITHGNYKMKTCDFVNNQLGDVRRWSLVEAFKSKDQLLNIFRYKLMSDKLDFPVELRITLTDLNKLTEFRFFKWEDKYSEELILMNWN